MNKNNIDSDTLSIFGVPRSGTSWMGQIFNSSPITAFRYQPLFSYEFKERINLHSTNQQIKDFYIDLLNAKSDFVLQKITISGKKGIAFPKEDPKLLVWKEVMYLNLISNLLSNSSTKLILMVRHPGAVINSWLSVRKEFDKNWSQEHEWRKAELKNEKKPENYFGYEKWKEATELFLKVKEQHPNRAMIIRYEDLATDPLNQTKEVFDFCNLQLGRQTKEFIQQSTSQQDKDPYGVHRKSKDLDGWKKGLNQKIFEDLSMDFDKSGLKNRLGY